MTLRRFFSKLRNFLQPRRAEEDLSREIASHLALLEEEFLNRGMARNDARISAKRAYGGIEQVKELHREERSFLWLEQARQDIRFSTRALAKNPGFTVSAVVTLALGIGANSAIFSVIDVALFKSTAYADPDRIVQIAQNIPAEESFSGRPFRLPAMSPQDAGQLRRNTKSLAEVAFYLPGSMVLKTAAGASIASVTQLSPQMSQVLGVQPQYGRSFRDGEDRAGSDNVVILSHKAWLKHFGGSPAAVGGSVVLDNVRYSVIGIMPRDFDFPDPRTEFWKPLVTGNVAQRQLFVFPVIARVKPDRSVAAASAEVNQVFLHLKGRQQSANQWVDLTPIREAQTATSRLALTVLAAAVGFVLLIACANVASLLLARGTRRQRENATRASLGASRGRLVRQSVVESLVLAFLGGAGGIAVAFASDRLLVRLWPPTADAAGTALASVDIGINGAVLLFTAGVSISTAFLFGLAPALQIWETDYMQAMKQGIAFVSSVQTRFKGYRSLGALVVVESATTFLLLVGAGLLIRSFFNISSVDPGFDTKNVLTFQVASATDETRNAFNEDLVQRLQALPSVEAAGYGELLPLELQSTLIRPFRLPGASAAAARVTVQPRTLESSWDYLRAVGFRLVAGRSFRPTDGAGPPVMLVNQTLAHMFFGGENPVGKFVYSLGSAPWEIVGVIEDTRQRGLGSQPEPQFFLEYRQLLRALPGWATDDIGRAYGARMYFAVRTSTRPAELIRRVQDLVRQLNPNAALNNVYRLQDVVSASVAGPAFYAAMVGIFSLLAIVLAAVGLFGVVSYAVTQRTQEIGIRVAVGAKRKDVLLLIMRQGMAHAGFGVVLGIAAAFLLTRYLQNMLFGLTAFDPATLVMVLLFYAAVAALACYVPARKATKMDPLTALRYE